jgi:hypothetical protein
MKRRDFISKAALSAFIVANLPMDELLASGKQLILVQQLPADLQAKFDALVQWMKDKGWLQFLADKLHIHVDPAGAMAQYQDLLTVPAVYGFDDFAGKQLLTPGSPQASLLYHMLASPRVRPDGFLPDQYPTFLELDTLENVIYSLKDYSRAPFGDMLLAVFSYEYRPAFKTPHHQHADLVFSRTGIARIGEFPTHYDGPNRCYSNKPENAANSKNVAVTPARYGVFLARLVNEDQFSQAARAAKGDDVRKFLLPVRKIFDGDALVQTQGIVFKEMHVNEKLASLVSFAQTNFGDQPGTNGSLFKLESYPFRIVSGTEEALAGCQAMGSSTLVMPAPKPLVRYAIQDGKLACLRVTQNMHTYFSAFETNPVTETIELIDDVSSGGMHRKPNDYAHPRLAPLFVNVKFTFDAGPTEQAPDFTFDEKKDAKNKITHREGALSDDAQHPLSAYYTALFVDGICDGCITADTSNWRGPSLPAALLANCLPAFSIVTAPDFFPLADPLDLAGFDRDGQDAGTNFFEGGLYSLSAERTMPNQRSKNPVTHQPAFDGRPDTLLAVISEHAVPGRPQTDAYAVPSDRLYQSSGYLPDVCSGIFAPGWDITYSNEANGPLENNYLSTRGLGSPFPEDMKLCAAMNGMWPVASPDSSRTYQGHLLPGFENPTAIPLLDTELGLHPLSAACTEHQFQPKDGWDGEQGPFLQAGGNSFLVNFADLARTDTGKNTLDNKLDISVLRDLTSAELRGRMACLRQCMLRLPEFLFNDRVIRYNAPDNLKRSPAMTSLWLVSAEAVNWDAKAIGLGIPAAFAGPHFDGLVHPASNNIRGPGFLFVFVITRNGSSLLEDSNRRTKTCKSVYICQVTKEGLAWCKVPGRGVTGRDQLIWNA